MPAGFSPSATLFKKSGGRSRAKKDYEACASPLMACGRNSKPTRPSHATSERNPVLDTGCWLDLNDFVPFVSRHGCTTAGPTPGHKSRNSSRDRLLRRKTAQNETVR